MILAAGRGTRLGSLGLTIPKALVPVGGRALLERHLEFLEREGVSRVVINAHHLARQMVSFVQNYRGGLTLLCVVEESLLGTAGGVRNALPLLGPEPFLVLYGDVLVDLPLAPLLDAHRRHAALATLAVYESASTDGKGVVRQNPKGRVIAFEEKSHRGAGPAFINAGLYVLDPALLAALPDAAVADFGDDVFPNALEQGLPVFAHRVSSPVIDIGTPDGLARARAVALEAV